MLEAANNVQAQLSAQELIELATPDKATLNRTSVSSNGDPEFGSVYILVLFSRRIMHSFCLYKMDFSVGNMVPFQ
jgi:hypothetical protein